MLKKVLFILISVFTVSHTYAQSADGRDETQRAIRTSVPFLTIAPDSKASAMGDAGVATSADINSQYWNVSKYAFMKEQAGVSLSYTPWLRSLGVTDLNLLYLAGYRKFDDMQALSGGLRYFNLGEIQEINEFGDPTGGNIRPHEFAVDLGYSRKFSDYISGGLAFRFIYSDIAAGTSNLASGARYEPGTSYAADINAFYEKPIQISTYDAEMAFGVNISNIGSKMSYSQDNESQVIPTTMRLGGRLSMDLDQYNALGFTLELSKLLVPSPTANDSVEIGLIEGVFKSFGDADNGFSEEIDEIMWSFGAEYMYMQQFAVRAGYFHEHETKGNRKYFTVGVGMNLNVFSLDFSYLFPATGGRSNPLANTMRFTLGFRFE